MILAVVADASWLRTHNGYLLLLMPWLCKDNGHLCWLMPHGCEHIMAVVADAS